MSIYSNFSAFATTWSTGPAKDAFFDIIVRAKGRLVPGLYVEAFLLLPATLGGTERDDNVVFLTPHEHVAAFRWAIESTIGRDRDALINEAWYHIQRQRSWYMDSESAQQITLACRMLADWLRVQPSVPHFGLKTLETREKMREAHVGKPFSDEHRHAISEAVSGENHPLWGTTRSPETRAKISAANSGPKHPNYGKSPSAATRAAIKRGQATAKRRAEKHAAQLAKRRAAYRAKTGKPPRAEAPAVVDVPVIEEQTRPFAESGILCPSCNLVFLEADLVSTDDGPRLCKTCYAEETL